MFAWVFQNTNLTIAGGYTTSASWRGATIFEVAWLAGWGLSLFDNSGFRQGGHMSFFAYDPDGNKLDTHQIPDTILQNNSRVPNPASNHILIKHLASKSDGENDARHAMQVATSQATPNLARAVIYLDNESPPDPSDFSSLLDYYRGFFGWLETQPAGNVTIRPGIYGHLNAIAPLLQDFPYLYVIDAAYARGALLDNLDRTSLNPAPFGLAVEFISSAHNLIPQTEGRNKIAAASSSNRGPGHEWLLWPTGFQWEGTNWGPLSSVPRLQQWEGSRFPISFNAGTWSVDYETALVDDPAYPSVSPRLAAGMKTANGSIPLALILRNSTGVKDGRQGSVKYCSVSPPSPVNAAALPASQPSPSPDHRPMWVSSPSHSVLVIPRRDQWHLVLETQELVGSSLVSRCKNIVSSSTPLAIHTRWAVAASDDQTAVLFCATPDGSLMQSRSAVDSSTWPAVQTLGTTLVHHYSSLGITSRIGQSVDVFFIDGNRVLHTAYWNLQGPGHQVIGRKPDELLPTSAIAACSPASDTIVVATVGYDLQLHVACWTTKGNKYWIEPYAVGTVDHLLCAHTDLAMAWNPSSQKVEVLATTNDLKICLYQLKEDPATHRWLPDNNIRAIFDNPLASLVQGVGISGHMGDVSPNPFGDLILSFSSSAQRLIGSVFNFPPGLTKAAIFSSPAGSAPPSNPTWNAI
jgi:hypothetical protein